MTAGTVYHAPAAVRYALEPSAGTQYNPKFFRLFAMGPLFWPGTDWGLVRHGAPKFQISVKNSQPILNSAHVFLKNRPRSARENQALEGTVMWWNIFSQVRMKKLISYTWFKGRTKHRAQHRASPYLRRPLQFSLLPLPAPPNVPAYLDSM